MLLNQAPVSTIQSRNGKAAVFPLSEAAEILVQAVHSDERYQRLDRTTHLAIAAARGTFTRLRSSDATSNEIGCISIGSSRGPTITLEQSLHHFEVAGRVAPLTSPTTTAGNISSWVAQDYLAEGCGISAGGDYNRNKILALTTSMTCSSALHSLLVAKSFVASKMAKSALFGGSEACLTPYTVAQLEALRIYGDVDRAWPSQPLKLEARENSVVLGEAAGTALLVGANNDSELRAGDIELLGVGWSLEAIPTPTGISEDGYAFEGAMRMALEDAGCAVEVGAVVAHAPGTLVGDQAEQHAIRRVFGDVLTVSTKHLTGHTYGASGMLSLGLADALLAGLVWRGFPYNSGLNDGGELARARRKPCKVVAINSAGFGGNALSVIVRRPPGS